MGFIIYKRMKEIQFPRISSVRFVTGARSLVQLPPPELFEIAVAGRSNVGKSSLLRLMLGVRKQVRVSRTPGRTREINFFRVDSVELPPLYWVDLPGYGYASVQRSLREEWGDFVTRYIETRQSLRIVLLLIDARREITDLEISFVQWMYARNVNLLFVMTKMDQVPKTHWGQVTQRMRLAFGSGRFLPFSAVSGFGAEEIWRYVAKVTSSLESIHS